VAEAFAQRDRICAAFAPHDHWHIDFSYVNVGGTFYYLCSILDGCSRFIVHWKSAFRVMGAATASGFQ
jgi:transposase InsO family protein